MYKQSNNKRLYSTTPIVKINEDGKEEIVCLIPLSKIEGDKFADKIIHLLNNEIKMDEDKKRFEEVISVFKDIKIKL